VLSPPVNVAAYMNPTKEMLDKGKSLYDMNCASCHGAEGKGDGVAGVSLNPKPRNFHDLNGWTNGTSLTMMYKTLHEGITNRGMASYANLPPEDRLNMIMYIRTFAQYPPITQIQLDSIDSQYSLTKGVKQPNQIPVKMAKDKILQEYSAIEARLVKMNEAISASNDSGAVMFKNISKDRFRSLNLLVSDTSWINNKARFVNIIENGAVNHSFKTKALYTLNENKINVLYNYLRNLYLNTR
ncbi:MAG: cytochrome c, partial [Ignavibacteria bacterium]|nr:cytochrome c [Ignavibacteria bacterium]